MEKHTWFDYFIVQFIPYSFFLNRCFSSWSSAVSTQPTFSFPPNSKLTWTKIIKNTEHLVHVCKTSEAEKHWSKLKLGRECHLFWSAAPVWTWGTSCLSPYSPRAVRRVMWTRISAARCATCLSRLRWWRSLTTRARSTPRGWNCCLGNSLLSQPKVGPPHWLPVHLSQVTILSS